MQFHFKAFLHFSIDIFQSFFILHVYTVVDKSVVSLRTVRSFLLVYESLADLFCLNFVQNQFVSVNEI